MSDRPAAPTVILVVNDGMGHADPALRHKLIRIYLTLLLEGQSLPGAICFYTEGVRLVVEGSPVLDLLRQIEARGVFLLSCQTCLSHYGLADKVQVGIVGGLYDIIEVQHRAAKVITI
jgi:hypothetical protein